MLGITGALQRMGPQSSLSRPDLIDYSESGSATDPASELLVDLYKSSQQRKDVEDLAQAEAAVQLQRNQAAMEQAKTELLAQALSAFTAPNSVI